MHIIVPPQFLKRVSIAYVHVSLIVQKLLLVLLLQLLLLRLVLLSTVCHTRGPWRNGSRCDRVGFLPAETCFCQTSGLNRFKLAKSGKNRKPLRSHGIKTAGVIIKVVNHINHQ